MNPLFLLIYFSIGLVSWILYAIVTRYIYSHRKQFNSAFTRLWNTFALVNLLQYITMKLYYQIPLHTPANSTLAPFFRDFPYQEPMTILYFFSYYFFYCQRICVFLIISISFRVIVFPFSSSPIWERTYFVTAIIIFITPLPFVLNVFFIKPVFNYIPHVDGFVLYPSPQNDYEKAARNLLLSNVFEISTAVLSTILKFSSLFCLSASTMRRRDDRNLYLVTTILFSASALKFLCAILIILNIHVYVQSTVVFLYPITADMVALSCPYALIYINPRLRESIFGCKWTKRRQTESTYGTSV